MIKGMVDRFMRLIKKDLTEMHFSGQYIPQTDTIIIDKSLKGWKQIRVLKHELGHRMFHSRFPLFSLMFCANANIVVKHKFYYYIVTPCFAISILFSIFSNIWAALFFLNIPFIMLFSFLLFEGFFIENLWGVSRWFSGFSKK